MGKRVLEFSQTSMPEHCASLRPIDPSQDRVKVTKIHRKPHSGGDKPFLLLLMSKTLANHFTLLP